MLLVRQAPIKTLALIFRESMVEQKLEEGELSVTNALKAQQAFSAEAKERVVSVEEKREVLESLSKVSTKEADKILAEKYPETKSMPEKVKPVAKNQNLIQFYVDDDTLKQIEELKAKFSHQMPSSKMEDLLKILIQRANRQAKLAPTQKSKTKPKNRAIRTRSRHIPNDVKREMEKTRHLGCNHISEASGDRCGSKHFLQMDHIHEYSQGGLNVAHNLQWLCSFHNRHRFETRRGDPYKQAKGDREKQL